MHIYIEDNYEQLSRQAADIISSQIREKPDSVLGLATGSSPIRTYELLVDQYQNGNLDFSKITTINLDEYRGLTSDNTQSYHYFMKQHLFSKVNICPQNVYLPNGMADDVEAECTSYDKLISSYCGADLQLLGLGQNGHIGFNEPACAFTGPTHLVALSEDTIKANSRLFENPNDVPKEAITMGIKSIFSAKKILLIACGHAKANALHEALYGPITPSVPASILQLHPNVTIVADKEALPDA